MSWAGMPAAQRFALAVLAATALSAAAEAQLAGPDLTPRLERAGVKGAVEASCRGGFREGQGDDYAVAVRQDIGSGRYLVLQSDGRTHDLAEYAGKPDLSCYTVREADRLNDTIAKSSTINGRVAAEWDGAVVCGFIEPAIAVCWQFAPEQGRFVRIGGWTT